MKKLRRELSVRFTLFGGLVHDARKFHKRDGIRQGIHNSGHPDINKKTPRWQFLPRKRDCCSLPSASCHCTSSATGFGVPFLGVPTIRIIVFGVRKATGARIETNNTKAGISV